MKAFQKFGLKQEMLKAIADLYYDKPTPIQAAAIPVALTGKDLIGQAHTGTGKTAAFLLPILNQLDIEKNHIQSLILTPTRELAIQISQDVQELGKYIGVNGLALHGGRDIEPQLKKLQNKVHIVVGTPGRILDHLRRESLHFGKIDTLVLDEADKMLEMGFFEEVVQILRITNHQKQTLLFSATMPDQVKQLAHQFMLQPQHIKVDMQEATSKTTEQYYILVNQSEKIEALLATVNNLQPYLGIIFVNTQKRVEEVTEQLQLKGLEAEALHGGLSQNKRERLMADFRKVKFQYLVCTDIASRGVDVEGITHVINYDLPSDAESYIHRVGRTGRAGQQGVAISFVSPRQKSILSKIETGIKRTIEERVYISSAHPLELGKKEPKKRKSSFRRSGQGQQGSRIEAGASSQEERKGRSKSSFTKEKEEQGKKKDPKQRVKPGYKKKQILAKKKEEQTEKRKRIQREINKTIKKKKRQASKPRE